MLLGGSKNIHVPNESIEEEKKRIAEFLDTSLEWLTESQEKAGGEPRLPSAFGGGGSFYPEIEKQFSNIVFLYAANQKEELLKTILEIKRLPSIEFEGKIIHLEEAPLEPTPAGRVRLEAIGDYKNPLLYQK